ncbi:MAG: hypothetical protein HC910_05925 [Spirulinaceae cyanobacterium SM2_1_0]|nr:hypothetical protein [Spirulinaceae cyanobacterium SM2_1_0]
MKRYWLLAIAVLGMTAGTLLPPTSLGAQQPQLEELNARADAEKPFETGYNLGYELGLSQGHQGRRQAATYAPQLDAETLKTWLSDRVRAGYQAGFFAGYQDGYHHDADNQTAAIQAFNTGYTDGYRTGLNNGNICRQQDCRYNPQPTVDPAVSATPEYDSGYRIGYWQGFEKGYTYWE